MYHTFLPSLLMRLRGLPIRPVLARCCASVELEFFPNIRATRSGSLDFIGLGVEFFTRCWIIRFLTFFERESSEDTDRCERLRFSLLFDMMAGGWVGPNGSDI
jgi:hypothetical protein